jgi:hypothetical protein
LNGIHSVLGRRPVFRPAAVVAFGSRFVTVFLGNLRVQVGNGGMQLLDVGADVGRGSREEGFRWQRHSVHAR